MDASFDWMARAAGVYNILGDRAQGRNEMELFIFARFHARPGNERGGRRVAGFPHAVRFVGRVEPLIDHPFDVTRGERIG
jgi:hypothetical protein